MRKELMRFKRMWVHKHFFQCKMVLDVHKGVKDVDKPKKEEEETDFEEKEETTLTGQLVNCIKQTNRLVILIVVI